jgi:uncharacterized protein (TIGR02145 family)
LDATVYSILCPIGWHVPTNIEWTTLVNYLGGESLAGDKFKEAGTTHLNSPNKAANETGFTALQGGLRPTYGEFDYMGIMVPSIPTNTIEC